MNDALQTIIHSLVDFLCESVSFFLCRFQQDVRIVRPLHRHVLLPKQTHHDRSRHWKQQQDQLGHGGQTGERGRGKKFTN